MKTAVQHGCPVTKIVSKQYAQSEIRKGNLCQELYSEDGGRLPDVVSWSEMAVNHEDQYGRTYLSLTDNKRFRTVLVLIVGIKRYGHRDQPFGDTKGVSGKEEVITTRRHQTEVPVMAVNDGANIRR